jgi:hypothetical protein
MRHRHGKLECVIDMGCRGDGVPPTQDKVEGGASIRVSGETLVVLEHEEASGTEERAQGRSHRNIGWSQGREGDG